MSILRSSPAHGNTGPINPNTVGVEAVTTLDDDEFRRWLREQAEPFRSDPSCYPDLEEERDARDIAEADWLAWVNGGGDPESYPGPGWDTPPYEPSPEESANHSGYQLGLDGEPCPGLFDSGVTYLEALATVDGWLDGDRERRRRERAEDAEMEAWLAAREAEVGDDWHDAERVRAVGAIEARKGDRC